MKSHKYLAFLALFLLTGLLGCELPAQMVWSPDGKRASWRTEDRAWLIDDKGSVIAPLGTTVGGFAWSSDSSSLYYIAKPQDTAPLELTPADTRWLDVATTQPADPQATTAASGSDDDGPMVLRRWSSKDQSGLAVLPRAAYHMAISPNDAWLAIVCPSEDEQKTTLYVYAIASNHLYLLSRTAQMGATFTGANRLAYIDASTDIGSIVEVTLDENQPKLARTKLVTVLAPTTVWMQAMDDDLLLTSISITLPGPGINDESNVPPTKLFAWTRATQSVSVIADQVGPLFAVSPDRQHILIERVTPKTETKPELRELVVVNANGSDPHVLRDLGQYPKLPMWPSWKDAQHIAFLPPATPDHAPKADKSSLFYDVMIYKIGTEGEMDLEPVQTLSEKWVDEMRPVVRSVPMDWGKPATQPATTETSPATQPAKTGI